MVGGENQMQDGQPQVLASLTLERLKRFPIQKKVPAFISILREGHNCFRISQVSRLSYLIDGSDFYRAIDEAIRKAERQVLITGWDIDTRIDLLQGEQEHQPQSFGMFLFEMAALKPDLNIYILSWDYALIYSLERETRQVHKFDEFKCERIHFKFDGRHPFTGSHHQKVVVVDDQVAFSGGLDICARRWDTPEHLANDDRRIDPWGLNYQPFHDVQCVLEGEAAKELGILVRTRWEQSTGETIAAPDVSGDRWPQSCVPDIEQWQVGISRTLPAFQNQKSSLEVERLFFDAIKAAQKFMFIENQYFTSAPIAQALGKRLQEKDGPEIVMIVPRDMTGWIEETTMGVLRVRAIKIIRSNDLYNRFRVFYPVVPGLEKGYLKVHSKVMVIDDHFARIGSANMSQRSMGLDTECDISFESGGEPRIGRAIASLRMRLLSEHLGVSPEEFEARFLMNGSLVETVDSFRTGARTLVPLNQEIPDWLDRMVPPAEVIDSHGPPHLKRFYRKCAGGFMHVIKALGATNRVVFAWTLGLAILLSFFIFWRQSFLHDFMEPEKIAKFFSHFLSGPLAVVWVLLGFIVGGFLLLPLMALIGATALLFSPLQAFALSLLGSLLSASATYFIGRTWRGQLLHHKTGRWEKMLHDRIEGTGVWGVVAIRLFPFAPFSVVNFVAGSLRVTLSSFFIGTLLGLLPGTFLITLLGGEISNGYQWSRILLILAALFLAPLFLRGVQRYFRLRAE